MEEMKDKVGFQNKNHVMITFAVFISVISGVLLILIFLTNYDFKNPILGSLTIGLHLATGIGFSYLLFRMMVRIIYKSRKNIRISEAKLDANQKITHDRFDLLTDAYHQLIELSNTTDVLTRAGNFIIRQLEKPITVVSLHDKKRKTMRVIVTDGFTDKADFVHKLTGFDIMTLDFPLSAISGDLKSKFSTGNLHLIDGGLFSLASGSIEKSTCEFIESELGIRYTYVIGVKNQEGYLGVVTLLLPVPLVEEEIKITEAINTLASAVVMRIEKTEGIVQSEKRYKSLISSSPVIGYSLNSSMQLTICTDYFYYCLGYNPEEVLNKSITEFLTETSAKYFEDYIFRKILTDGACIGDELEWIKADGSIMTMMHNGVAFENEKYGTSVTNEILTDITQRKKAEASLRLSENKYRCLVHQAKAGIFEISPAGRIVFANDEVVSLLGYEIAELLGKDIFDLFRADELIAVEQYFEKMKNEIVHNLILKINHKIKDTIYLLVSSTPIRDDVAQTNAIILYVTDITASEIARQEIKQSESFFRALYEQSPLPYHALSINGNILDANNAWLSTLGYEKHEVVGHVLSDFLEEETNNRFQEEYKIIVKKGGARNLERIMVCKSGEKRIMITNAKVVLDKNGNFLQTHSVLTDITEKMNAEIEIKKMYDTLEQKIKERTSSLEEANKELDSFAYSVSHDLRTPIRHISGFLEMMQLKKATMDEQTRNNYMEIIFESAHKMGTMIDDLLLFSKMSRTEIHKKKINMTALFTTIYREQTEIAGSRTIKFRIAELPEVLADVSMIRLAVTNLISNAIKYSRNVLEAQITVTSETDTVLKEFIYTVADNGAGFDMTYYEKLFGVFQRLHSQSEFEGTGIGLANTKRIIQRHGGRIWAWSKPGEGARFSFALPM